MKSRVFVIDEDPLAVRDLAAALEREGRFEVDAFGSGRAALGMAVGAPPDAVIVGLRLSDGSGFELVRELEAVDSEMASLILTSATDTGASAEAAAIVGPLRLVHKPVSPADLLPKLHAQLERRQLICDLQAMAATLAQRDRALEASRRQEARTAAELQTTHSELATATERLVQSEQLAAVGRVLGGIAHEIDHQLALVGYAEAIKSRVADDTELVELAEIIVTAQKRLAGMVEEIRDFAAGTAAGEPAGPLDREPADVAAVVDETLSILRFDPDVRKRTLERIYRAHPLVALHRQKFGQVVLNLVSNAVLATEPGDTVCVELDVDESGSHAVLTVVDHGIGMPPDVLRRLGEPFFTTRGDRGSGLGVGICKRIVEEHGGRLVYTSEVGAGTTARVSLPIIGGELSA